MGLFSNLMQWISPAPSPEELTVVFHELDTRLAEPDFTILPPSRQAVGRIGTVDLQAPTETEIRTAYRGLVALLTRMRADAIANALCRAVPKRQVGHQEFEDLEEGHPWRVLWSRPTPHMSQFEYFFDMSQMRDLSKGAFSGVGRNELGVPECLYFIYPNFGTVNAVPNLLGGIEAFTYTNNGGAIERIEREDIIWMRHRHPVTPYESKSLLEQAAFNADIDLFQNIYARDMTSEGNAPQVYVSTKNDLTETQSMEIGRRLSKEYRSVEQDRRKTLVLGSGSTLEKVGLSPDEMQYIEAAELNARQTMVIFGFQPAMFEKGGVVSNSREVRRQWLQNSIQPEVNLICSSWTHQLRIAFDAVDSDLVIVAPDVVPMDPLETQRIREIQFRTGQRSVDEFRMEDGMDTVPGGDQYFMSAGLVPVEQPEEEEAEEMETAEDDS